MRARSRRDATHCTRAAAPQHDHGRRAPPEQSGHLLDDTRRRGGGRLRHELRGRPSSVLPHRLHRPRALAPEGLAVGPLRLAGRRAHKVRTNVRAARRRHHREAPVAARGLRAHRRVRSGRSPLPTRRRRDRARRGARVGVYVEARAALGARAVRARDAARHRRHPGPRARRLDGVPRQRPAAGTILERFWVGKR